MYGYVILTPEVIRQDILAYGVQSFDFSGTELHVPGYPGVSQNLIVRLRQPICQPGIWATLATDMFLYTANT